MKRLFVFLPVLLLCLAAIVAASASVPRMMLRAPVSEVDGIDPADPDQPKPRAEVDQRKFDFGIMDPLTMGQHTFTIHNRGDAPLRLQAGSTTCKCTLSEITQDVVAPGESGQVVLTWNTGSKHAFYSHGATIHTNDPFAREIDLRVQGNVRILLGTDPETIVLDRVEPDEATQASFAVFSEIWDSFAVGSLTCSVEGATWEVVPAETEFLEQVNARSGYRVHLTLPAGMPDGFFNELVTLEVKPPADAELAADSEMTANSEGTAEHPMPDDESVTLVEIPVTGKVLRRLSVYGPGLDHLGTVDLGILERGQGLQRRLLLKLRDPEREMGIGEIEVQPDFLKVRVTDCSPAGEAKGLYHLDIEVPESAPVCAYRGAERGSLKLHLDHPRVQELTLGLRLAVVGSR